MTAYVSRGDRAILYVGNLTDPELDNLRALLDDEGVEVIGAVGRRDLAPAYAGPPSLMIVIEKDDACSACGYSPTKGDPLDGVIVDEVVGTPRPAPGQAYTVLSSDECPRTDAHSAHTWFSNERGVTAYCSGVRR